MIIKASEKGQALILITLAAIGLFAFAALAIDGSAVFSDRRHAQNAADTAALEAALTKIRHGNWQTKALVRASSNGYDNNGTTNEVVLYNPPVDGPYAGNTQYIQVKIKSEVKTSLSRVIGFDKATNHVQAVARASLPEVTTWFDGNALVSVMEGCRSPGNPYDPFVVGGNSTTIVNNSGIFVNSTCDPAFEDTGNSNSVKTSRGVCVVGGVEDDVSGVEPEPTENCGSQIDPDRYQLINPSCGDQVGGIVEISPRNYLASPGKYEGDFPGDALPHGSPAGTLKLQRGIYCLEEGLDLSSGWIVTTNLNDNVDANGKDIHDSESEGILLFIPGGDVRLNGGSTLNVHAVNSTADNFPEGFLNYLIYIPPSNEADVTITGNNGSSFTGTILAPASHITLDGSGNTFSLDAQIIGYNTTITGSGRIDITYNQANNAVTVTHPGVELSQ